MRSRCVGRGLNIAFDTARHRLTIHDTMTCTDASKPRLRRHGERVIKSNIGSNVLCAGLGVALGGTRWTATR
jgi:hypothetical protein